MRYFAFDLGTDNIGSEIEVDTDPAALWQRLATLLNENRDADSLVDSLVVGQVEADNTEDAINAVRSEQFIEGTEGYCSPPGYKPKPIKYKEEEPSTFGDGEEDDDDEIDRLLDEHIGKVDLFLDPSGNVMGSGFPFNTDAYLGEFQDGEFVPSNLLLRSQAGFQKWVDDFARKSRK